MTGRPRFLTRIADIDAASWNALAGSAQPFARHEFLLAMEESGCAAREPAGLRHLAARGRAGPAIGRDAAVSEVAFPGRVRVRFLLGERLRPARRRLLSEAGHGDPLHAGARRPHPVRQRRRRARSRGGVDSRGQRTMRDPNSSPRGMCCFRNESLPGAARRPDSIERRDCQFHWLNRGYDSFEAFLATFTSEKRKKAKRERRRVAEAGIEFDTRSGRRDGR